MSKPPSEPLSDRTANDHHHSRWTCPGCYRDLPVDRPGLHSCPHCQSLVECSRESFISCVAELVQDEARA
ncbi:MAG: hypothetical protein ACLFTP_10800 [Rhodosalinus sp.]